MIQERNQEKLSFPAGEKGNTIPGFPLYSYPLKSLFPGKGNGQALVFAGDVYHMTGLETGFRQPFAGKVDDG